MAMNASAAAQAAVQKVLNEALVQARMRNPAYSLRAFAKKLALSPAAISEILNGKRKVSKKMAARIAAKLALDPEASRSLLDGFSPPDTAAQTHTSLHSLPDSGAVISRQELDMDQFKLIADWYHFAIHSLAQTRDFRDDPKWIARRLGLRIPDVKAALERLERLGMLKRTSYGKLRPTDSAYATPDEIASLAAKRAHAQHFELARRSLEEDPVHQRDITGIIMAIDPDQLPLAKQMIRTFGHQLSTVLKTEKPTEVYSFCVQLIPLTRDVQFEKEIENDIQTG